VLILGTFATVTTFLLFYLMTVFTISWGTSALHYPKQGFLIAEIIATLFFGLGIPISAVLADKYGRVNMLIVASLLILIFGLFFSPLFSTGNWNITVGFLILGLFLMGLTYGPIGTALAEIFPPMVRYTGASLAFTFAGILGASLTPYLATKLAKNYGLPYVGYFLAASAIITLIALLITKFDKKAGSNIL
jgi:MFS family permease